MRSRRPVAALVLALVAVGAVAAAWLREIPDISSDDAVAAAEAAFEDAAVAANVQPVATPRRYRSQRQPGVEVWTVRATVRDTPIDLLLARSGAQPVVIDDRTTDRTAHALSDDEYERVAEGIKDLSLQRTVRRNLVFTLAASLIVALSLALATTPKPEETP